MLLYLSHRKLNQNGSVLKVKKKVFLELIKQIAKATFVDANNILDCDAGDGTLISEKVTSLVVTESFEDHMKGSLHAAIVNALRNVDFNDTVDTTKTLKEKKVITDVHGCSDALKKIEPTTAFTMDASKIQTTQDYFFSHGVSINPLIALLFLRQTPTCTVEKKNVKSYFMNMHAQIPSNHRQMTFNRCFGGPTSTENSQESSNKLGGIVDNILDEDRETMLNVTSMVAYFYMVTNVEHDDCIKLETIIAQLEEIPNQLDTEMEGKLTNPIAGNLRGRSPTKTELIDLYNIISVHLGSQCVSKY